MTTANHPIVPLRSVVVRSAQRGDYDRLCELYESLDSYHRSARPELFVKPRGRPRTLEQITKLIEGPQSKMLVAEIAGAIVGLAVVIERELPSHPVHRHLRHGELDELVVDAAYRRKGVAQRLIRACEAWARERGIASMRIGVWAFNDPARTLYERMGYEVHTLRFGKAL